MDYGERLLLIRTSNLKEYLYHHVWLTGYHPISKQLQALDLIDDHDRTITAGFSEHFKFCRLISVPFLGNKTCRQNLGLVSGATQAAHQVGVTEDSTCTPLGLCMQDVRYSPPLC